MSDIILRQCTKCKQFKPPTPEFFHVCNSKPSGFASHCKVCRGNANRKPVNPEDIVPEGYKRCTKCKNIYPTTADFFHIKKSTKDGLRSRCKECRSKEKTPYTENCKQYHQQYYVNHKEQHRLYSQQYLKTHREQCRTVVRNRAARKSATKGTHTAQQIREQLKRQHYRCYYAACGFSKFEKRNGKYVYEVEHTFPLVRIAGTDIPANDMSYLVLSCPFCNQSKGSKFPWEWPEGGRLL